MFFFIALSGGEKKNTETVLYTACIIKSSDLPYIGHDVYIETKQQRIALIYH